MHSEVLLSVARSFYTFSKTGDFSPILADIGELSIEDAYRCQEIHQQLRYLDGDEPVGYKVGCTSAAIRQQFGFNNPICGRLTKGGMINEGTPILADDYYSLAIEPELVLTLKNNISNENATDDEILDSIDYVQPGIELHNYVYHYPKPTRQELICSNGIHAGQITGNHRVKARDIHWTLEGVAVFVNGDLVASGVAADVMGGPLESVRFLIKHLKQHDQGLKAGEHIIPGSATSLIPVKRGDEVTCSFTHAGSVSTAIL